MRYVDFRVSNFKGIPESGLSILCRKEGRIVTLIGLNESGKTTILEAIEKLGDNIKMSEIFYESFYNSDPNDYIPLSKKANFNEEISIRTTVEISDDEKRSIIEYRGFNLEVQFRSNNDQG